MYQKGWYLMRGGQKKLTYERCKCSLGIRWVNSREKEQTVNKDKRARTQQRVITGYKNHSQTQ